MISKIFNYTKEPLLFTLVRDDQIDAIEAYLSSGGNVNLQSKEHKCSIANLAARLGKIKVLELLIKHEANFALLDIYKNTCLLAAAEEGQLSVVEWLLRKGYSKSAFERDMHGYTALLKAVASGNQQMVSFLITNRFSYFQFEVDYNGNKAFLVAVSNGLIEMMQFLLDNNWAKTYARNCDGPATIAATNASKPEALKWLIRKGYGSAQDVDIYNRTVFMAAPCGNEQDKAIEIMQWLLTNQYINERRRTLETSFALMNAAGLGRDKVVTWLLQQKDIDVNWKFLSKSNDYTFPTHVYTTALKTACSSKYKEIAISLILAGANCNKEDISFFPSETKSFLVNEVMLAVGKHYLLQDQNKAISWFKDLLLMEDSILQTTKDKINFEMMSSMFNQYLLSHAQDNINPEKINQAIQYSLNIKDKQLYENEIEIKGRYFLYDNYNLSNRKETELPEDFRKLLFDDNANNLQPLLNFKFDFVNRALKAQVAEQNKQIFSQQAQINDLQNTVQDLQNTVQKMIAKLLPRTSQNSNPLSKQNAIAMPKPSNFF